MSWFTPPGGTDRTHTATGARNMREHRLVKREQAAARQALEALWRTRLDAPPGGTSGAPVKRKRKRKKPKKSNGSVTLAAIEAATGEWLDRTGPGVDF